MIQFVFHLTSVLDIDKIHIESGLVFEFLRTVLNGTVREISGIVKAFQRGLEGDYASSSDFLY